MQALQLQISHPILSSMVDPVLSHLDLVFGSSNNVIWTNVDQISFFHANGLDKKK